MIIGERSPVPGERVPRSVVVSGSSSGIGAAACAGLAAAGWRVFAGVRRPSDVPTVGDSCPGSVEGVQLDVTDHASVAAAGAEVRRRLHGATLTALINNAGIGQLAPIQTVPPEELRAVFDVNVFGSVALTQAMLSLMGQGSRVVFIGSVGDRITMPFGGALTSSKWALASIAEAFRLELVADGIDVALVEPGSIHTPAVDKVEQAAERTAAALRETNPALAARFARAAQRAVANERSGSNPDVVASTVVNALTSVRPRTRYLTGRHAHALAALGQLPDPLFDRVRLRIFDQPSQPITMTSKRGSRK